MKDLLDSLGKEEKADIKEITLEKDSGLEGIVKLFESIKWDSNNYYGMNNYLKNLDSSSEDITIFSIYLSKYQNTPYWPHIGYFISRLINNSKDTNFKIRTNHFESNYSYLGAYNTKNIFVDGSVGDFLGECMQSGDIIVSGDCSHYGGFMMGGGIIRINGKVKDFLADEARNGTIYVAGNAGREVGHNITNQVKIKLGGDFENISYTCNAEVYRKDKLIFKKGVPVKSKKDLFYKSNYHNSKYGYFLKKKYYLNK